MIRGYKRKKKKKNKEQVFKQAKNKQTKKKRKGKKYNCEPSSVGPAFPITAAPAGQLHSVLPVQPRIRHTLNENQLLNKCRTNTLANKNKWGEGKKKFTQAASTFYFEAALLAAAAAAACALPCWAALLEFSFRAKSCLDRKDS